MSKLEIEIGDTVSFLTHREYTRSLGVCIDICFGGNGTYRISWDDYNASWVDFKDLTLIKKGKTMQFTKSDLKTGMFVKHRDGDYAILLEDTATGRKHYTELHCITEALLSSIERGNDITHVYVKAEPRSMNSHLKGLGLRCIWERTEQTEAQKEMKVLQEQAKALQEQITKLQGKL
jgi:phage tail protein X